MSLNVTVIDSVLHEAFLQQQRRDPVTREPFQPGDRVVICAADESAFLEDSWIAVGAKHCDQTATLPSIPDVQEPRPFRHPVAPAANAEPAVPEETFASAKENYDATEPEMAAVLSEPIRLHEIPNTLREIPLRLREIGEL